MRKTPLIFLTFLMSTSGVAFGQLQIDIKLKAGKNFVECECIPSVVEWRNVGKEPLRIAREGGMKPTDSIAVSLWLDDQQKLTFPFSDEFIDYTASAQTSLNPGESRQAQLDLRKLNAPLGKHVVRVVADFTNFPPGFFQGRVESKPIELTVLPATGTDQEALEFARKHYDPSRVIPEQRQDPVMRCGLLNRLEVIELYPRSIYAAWMLVEMFKGFSTSDFAMVVNSIESGDYMKREIWVPAENASETDLRPVRGIEALDWKRRHFQTVLLNHPDFPFADQFRLMLALDELAMKQYELASRDLQQLVKESTTDMKEKATLCMQLAQQKGWIKVLNP